MIASKYLLMTCIASFLVLTNSCSKQSNSNASIEDVSSRIIIKSAEPELANNSEQINETAHRQLGAHVHGAASMTITLDENQLNIAMSIPGMDAVGFEHAAISDEDQTRLNETLSYLQKPNSIFILSDKAECKLIKGEVATALLNRDAASNSHADIDINYEWECKNSLALTSIPVQLFLHFSHLQRINASWIAYDKQGAAELSPTATLLSLE